MSRLNRCTQASSLWEGPGIVASLSHKYDIGRSTGMHRSNGQCSVPVPPLRDQWVIEPSDLAMSLK
ncbi:hypothetical protein Pmar_PMAR023802 [Perkinsus marinus ATCC 50983]|uniref:Uncharacterized protein n=1 Tax=Perkinsus marinus (strain ATCC 50983 / TXsc) TaxID=423536 RepID=C5KYJ3_PERM5|nr:hypothetical protein Pmar_PMAR023802 [Perkinsus marinus ATCC 50983]EER10428.1 hypothetical protein Pmar_PMAR023802 [Perkinsus marinus ATCC 50983]|eukprot:XP_002778633.1 hypothetical protein Pmar_PMAR023802 [Perkinsus marinus ATCC 50983]